MRPNHRRRQLLATTFASTAVLFLPTLTRATGQISTPISVPVEGIKDVPSLIAAVKKAGGRLLPSVIPDKMFYDAFAKIYVKNAAAAANKGFKVPKWILNRLPIKRKVAFPILGIAIFTLCGITFAVPVAAIIVAVGLSVSIMAIALKEALRDSAKASSSV